MSMIISFALTATLLLGAGATDRLPSSFVSKQNVIELGRLITGNMYDVDHLMSNTDSQSLMENVRAWSRLYKPNRSHAKSEIHLMLDSILPKQEISRDLENEKEQLLNYFGSVDRFYQDSLEYASTKSYSNATKQLLINEVLLGTMNLPRLLTMIHDTFYFSSNNRQGLVSQLIRRLTGHHPSDCERSVSPQQLFYSLYTQLIVNELISLATLKHVYAMKTWTTDPFNIPEDVNHPQVTSQSRLAFVVVNDYAGELSALRSSFESRVRYYNGFFSSLMPTLTQHVYKCNLDTPRHGIDFLELVKFSQFKLLEPITDRPDCGFCPHPLMINEIARQEGAEVTNCRELGHTVEICPADSSSGRRYLWWKDEAGNQYGHHTQCPNKRTIDAGQYVGKPRHFDHSITVSCVICACSMADTWALHYNDDYKSFFRINPTAQVSDIWNNKIVTGVRFINGDSAIILQIQESTFTGMGINHQDTAWKGMYTRYYENKTAGSEMLDMSIRVTSGRKTVLLDDIIVPAGFVITGAKLGECCDNSAFRLYVHATKFNFMTGELDPSTSFWCDTPSCDNKPPNSDYRRDRIDIDMGKADNPIRGTTFKYDPESNKQIQFRHTDLYKDGGQTTIPFFDSQDLYAQPAFPLSGIGLYLRGEEGFGGYIAPRIFTFDVSSNIV